MIKIFLLIYGLGITMTGVGWLAHMYGLSMLSTLAVSTGIVSISIVATIVVIGMTYDGKQNE